MTKSDKAAVLRTLPPDALEELVSPIDGTTALKLICLDSVHREEVSWLWEPYIPLGKVTICQGDPGRGKTFFATRLAAIVTTGGTFPAGEGETIKPCNVIFQTAEDGIADTIKARLEDAGANCKRIFVIDESESALTLDDERLKEAIRITGAKLVIIDPIQAYLGADKDMHRANEIRPVMSRLGRMAEELKVAILVIGHLNKAVGTKIAYRGLGSIDLVAAARSILTVEEYPEHEYRRAIVQTKSSLAPNGDTVLFDLDPALGFLWAGVSDMKAEEILNYKPPVERSAPERDDCVAYLKDLLAYGDLPADEAKASAVEHGFSIRTIDRAKKPAGVRSYKTSDNGWYWTTQERHTKTQGNVGNVGNVEKQERQERQEHHHNEGGNVEKGWSVTV